MYACLAQTHTPATEPDTAYQTPTALTRTRTLQKSPRGTCIPGCLPRTAAQHINQTRHSSTNSNSAHLQTTIEPSLKVVPCMPALHSRAAQPIAVVSRQTSCVKAPVSMLCPGCSKLYADTCLYLQQQQEESNAAKVTLQAWQLSWLKQLHLLHDRVHKTAPCCSYLLLCAVAVTTPSGRLPAQHSTAATAAIAAKAPV
jgi:hypothetical protein